VWDAFAALSAVSASEGSAKAVTTVMQLINTPVGCSQPGTHFVCSVKRPSCDCQHDAELGMPCCSPLRKQDTVQGMLLPVSEPSALSPLTHGRVNYLQAV
jgi:hypothetical protein